MYIHIRLGRPHLKMSGVNMRPSAPDAKYTPEYAIVSDSGWLSNTFIQYIE